MLKNVILSCVSDQIGLFGGVTPGPTRGSETAYYLAMSSMQKFIRRGMAENAVKAARYMYDWRPPSLRRRLMVICLEDIGLGDLDEVVSILDLLKQGRLSFDAYADLIGRMCGCVKNRDTDDAFNIVLEMRTGGACTMPYGVDVAELDFLVEHAIYLDSENNRNAEFWSWAKTEATARSERCLEYVSFLESVALASSWHANHLALLILWRWDGDSVSPHVGEDSSETVGDVIYVWGNGAFADLGMDGHTRQGRRINEQVGEMLGMDPADVHRWDFFDRGARLNVRRFWANDYRRIVTMFFTSSISGETLLNASRLLRQFRRETWDALALSRN